MINGLEAFEFPDLLMHHSLQPERAGLCIITSLSERGGAGCGAQFTDDVTGCQWLLGLAARRTRLVSVTSVNHRSKRG